MPAYTNKSLPALNNMLTIKDNPGDGNCFYHAVADVLNAEKQGITYDDTSLKQCLLEHLADTALKDTRQLDENFLLVCGIKIEKLADETEDLNTEIRQLKDILNMDGIEEEYKQQTLQTINKIHNEILIKQQELQGITSLKEHAATKSSEQKLNILLDYLCDSALINEQAAMLYVNALSEYMQRPIYIIKDNQLPHNPSIHKINTTKGYAGQPIFLHYDGRHYQALLPKSDCSNNDIVNAISDTKNNARRSTNNTSSASNSSPNSFWGEIKSFFNQFIEMCSCFVQEIKSFFFSSTNNNEESLSQTDNSSHAYTGSHAKREEDRATNPLLFRNHASGAEYGTPRTQQRTTLDRRYGNSRSSF